MTFRFRGGIKFKLAYRHRVPAFFIFIFPLHRVRSTEGVPRSPIYDFLPRLGRGLSRPYFAPNPLGGEAS